MQELNYNEVDEVSGGLPYGVMLFSVVSFGLGFYNGYKDAEAAAAK